ncbi:MAG: MBL fold metallo-hydrolase [Hyphomicrobiaceae bacterium]|nr:MAG: MBL fold metallo-hydrolase [Hyphomicrobiaceae bacterium]
MDTVIQLGDIKIHRVVEQQQPMFDALDFFPSLTKEVLDQNRAWLEPHYLDPATGKIVICVQSYVVQTLHHNILIDSCVGNHKPRPGRPFWHMQSNDRYERALAATGLTFDDIDYVMCTHLHVDHVGWNTRLESGRWVPTFPKARYLFADRELAFWTQKQKEDPASWPWISDSVLPIVEANRAEVVRSDHVLGDLVQLMPTPGHTIDHYSVHVGKPGQDALITGDMIHSPIQARFPDLGMRADYDSRLAGQTRRKVFGRFCDTSTLMCMAHFPSPSTGRITRRGDGFDFIPG